MTISPLQVPRADMPTQIRSLASPLTAPADSTSWSNTSVAAAWYVLGRPRTGRTSATADVPP